MTAQKLEIWFEFASTYSALTVLRVEPLAEAAGVELLWRPFLLGPVFQSKGMTDSPFNLDPEKGRHMWRDLARRGALQGLDLGPPPVFPARSLLAARVMTAALAEHWAPAFARAVYRASFVERRDIADRDVIAEALRHAGANPDRWLAIAGEAEAKAALRANTEEAMSLGLFGAPTLRVGDELFWGDDRLEEALDWARGRHPMQAR